MNARAKIFVTGGTGALGSAIVAQLCAHDYAVTANYFHDETRARELARRTGCDVARADVRDENAVQSLFESRNFDAIIHAAGTNCDALLLRTSQQIWREQMQLVAGGVAADARELAISASGRAFAVDFVAHRRARRRRTERLRDEQRRDAGFDARRRRRAARPENQRDLSGLRAFGVVAERRRKSARATRQRRCVARFRCRVFPRANVFVAVARRNQRPGFASRLPNLVVFKPDVRNEKTLIFFFVLF